MVDGAPERAALMSTVSRRPDHIGAWTHTDRHESGLVLGVDLVREGRGKRIVQHRVE